MSYLVACYAITGLTLVLYGLHLRRERQALLSRRK